MSLVDVATACGVSGALIAYIEKRTQRAVTDGFRQRWADLFGEPVGRLFDERGWARPLPGVDANPLPPRPWELDDLTPETARRAVRLYAQGIPRYEIARCLNISRAAVDRARRDLGVSDRGRHPVT